VVLLFLPRGLLEPIPVRATVGFPLSFMQERRQRLRQLRAAAVAEAANMLVRVGPAAGSSGSPGPPVGASDPALRSTLLLSAFFGDTPRRASDDVRTIARFLSPTPFSPFLLCSLPSLHAEGEVGVPRCVIPVLCESSNSMRRAIMC